MCDTIDTIETIVYQVRAQAAANGEMLGDATEVHRHHEDVGDQLRAFWLEVVLSHPECVVAALIHALGILHDFVQGPREFWLRETPFVDRRPRVAEVLHIDGAKIGTVEFRDHRLSSVLSRRAGYWYGSYDMAGGVRQPPCQ